MPVFLAELNRLADRIKRSNLTLYLHTEEPTDSDNDKGRVTTGGGVYASGATITPANISRDSDGDLVVTAETDFGEATADLGTIAWYSLFRGTEEVCHDTLPSTNVKSGDSYSIDANVIKINGKTSSA